RENVGLIVHDQEGAFHQIHGRISCNRFSGVPLPARAATVPRLSTAAAPARLAGTGSALIVKCWRRPTPSRCSSIAHRFWAVKARYGSAWPGLVPATGDPKFLILTLDMDS